MNSALRTILAVTLVTCVSWMAQAGDASGTLEVNGKTYQITHAYGIAVEDAFEKGKDMPMLILSDRPLPEKLLNEKTDFFELRDAGMNGMKMEFYSNGSNYSMMLVGAGVEGSVSVSGTFDADQFSVYEPAKLAGKIAAEKSVGDTTFKYNVVFATDVLPRKAKVAPTAAQLKAAQSAASAKAYLAFNQAVRDGKLDVIRGLVVRERAAMMDSPDFKNMLGLIQAMMPADIAVVKATETGDDAELELTGKQDGKEKDGTVTMKKVGGKWLVEKESWK
ncbi:MAG: hypothetical protein KJZ70_14220 [Bryobacterales bacterium]|nr:hypothetical protein [Bryobacterales bacterium]